MCTTRRTLLFCMRDGLFPSCILSECQPKPDLARHQEHAKDCKARLKHARRVVQALTNTYVSFLLCYVWLMFKLAYQTHSGELMRAKRTVTLWLYCAPSPRKTFLPVCKPHFKKSHFSLRVVFQILCFTKLRFLQLHKRFLQKFQFFFGLWRLRPQSRTADARCYGSRLTGALREPHLLCKASLRIPTPCPCFMHHFEHNLSGTSGICIFSSKLITYCAVVRVV